MSYLIKPLPHSINVVVDVALAGSLDDVINNLVRTENPGLFGVMELAQGHLWTVAAYTLVGINLEHKVVEYVVVLST